MKKLGLLAGIGPESTIEYYRLLIKTYQEKLDTDNYPEMVLNSINMTKMLNYVFNDQQEELVDFLCEKLDVLKASGADFAALASNTPHIVFDRLVRKTSIPLVSIVEVCCAKISKMGLKRVGLIGTKSTMNGGFYEKAARKYDIEIVVPHHEDQSYIHEIYMNELVLNIIKSDTKSRIIDIVLNLKDEVQLEGLILGGTELPLLLNQADFNDLVIFNTTKIHVDSLVETMCEA